MATRSASPRRDSRRRSRSPTSMSRSPPPHRRAYTPSRSPSRSRSRSLSYSRSPERNSGGGGGGANDRNWRAVHLQGLTMAVHERHLKYIFGAYGQVEDVLVHRFSLSGEPKGTALLVFATHSAATMAVSHMHKGQIDGGVVQVELHPATKVHSDRRQYDRRGGDAPTRGGGDYGHRREYQVRGTASSSYAYRDERSSYARDKRDHQRSFDGRGSSRERRDYAPPPREDRYVSSRHERERHDRPATACYGPNARDRDRHHRDAAQRDAGWSRRPSTGAAPRGEFGERGPTFEVGRSGASTADRDARPSSGRRGSNAGGGARGENDNANSGHGARAWGNTRDATDPQDKAWREKDNQPGESAKNSDAPMQVSKADISGADK